MTPDDQRAAVECMARGMCRLQLAGCVQDDTDAVQLGPCTRENCALTKDATAALRALLDAGWSVSRTPDADAERLRAALRKLANEVEGAWGIAELDIRCAIGNTNYQCVKLRIDEARAELGEARDG